jgi:LemA protein
MPLGTVNTVWVVLLVILVVLAVHLIMTYNDLVMVKNNAALAWANVDVLLKQRHDEIPKLVEVCKQYMQFEQETLVRVTEARSRVATAREAQNIDALGPAEAALRAGVAKVFALAEAYPNLKANQNFMQLQSRITGLENAIADRREFYNDSVNVNNIRIQQFPDAIIARAFGFKEVRMLDFNAQELADVDVKSLFVPNAKGKAA